MIVLFNWSKRTFLKNIIKIFIIILTFSLPHHIVEAQSSDKRPKIGLALSGGGSLGMAHVGVLKVMEEAGLRPDYITGVSMGSIIGGMYSIGYTADSLHKILKKINWELILSNKIPENKVVFHEKEHYDNSIISLPVSARKVKLPSGLINGQQVENMLSFYAWPAADISNFSMLPIPFMCLGADILTGKKVELKTGYLPDAIRASMAVPSIFTPLKIDTAILIDGGILRNIAVSEVRNMGADIVIGSYTGFHPYREEELQSVSGILKQIGFLNSVIDYNQQKKLIDVLIEPELKGFSSTIFTNVDSIIQRGYRAALPHKEYFRKLADSLNRIGPQKPIKNILDKQYYSFDRIEVTGNEINSDQQIIGSLDIKPGEKIDKYIIIEKIELLYGKAWFEKVKFRIVPRNDSLILVIDCIENPKVMLFGGVHYDNSIRSGIVFRMTFKNLLTPRSLTDLDSYLGQFYRFKFSYLQFIDRNEKFGLSANFYADNTLLPIMKLRGETGQVFSRSSRTGLTLNKSLGLNHMMSISANLENLNLIPDYISVNQLKKASYNYLSATYINQVNTLDTKHFPNRGMIAKLLLSTTKLFSGIVQNSFYKKTYKEDSPDDFLFKRSYTFLGNIKSYFSPNRRLSFAFSGDALFTYESDSIPSPNNYYLLGGIESVTTKSIPMTGFHSNEIAIDKLARIGIDTDIQLYENIHINLMTDFAIAHEIGTDKSRSFLAGYGVGVGYMSIIGPLKVGLMHGISNRERYFNEVKGYVSFGYSF